MSSVARQRPWPDDFEGAVIGDLSSSGKRAPVTRREPEVMSGSAERAFTRAIRRFEATEPGTFPVSILWNPFDSPAELWRLFCSGVAIPSPNSKHTLLESDWTNAIEARQRVVPRRRRLLRAVRANQSVFSRQVHLLCSNIRGFASARPTGHCRQILVQPSACVSCIKCHFAFKMRFFIFHDATTSDGCS